MALCFDTASLLLLRSRTCACRCAVVAVLASSCARKCCILALISSNTDDTWPAPNVPVPVPPPTVREALGIPTKVEVPAAMAAAPLAAVASESERPAGAEAVGAAAADAVDLAGLAWVDDDDDDDADDDEDDEEDEEGRVGGRPDAAALPALPPPRVGDDTDAVSDFPLVDTDLVNAFLGALGEDDVVAEEEDESVLPFAALMVDDRTDCVGRNMICCC